MKGDEHLFLDVNLHRIANHVSPEDVEHLMQKNVWGICNHPNKKELFAIRTPNLGELRILTPIIQQICDCLLTENNYAVVALTNMLFEATFKFSLVYLERSRDENFENLFTSSLQQYEGKNLRDLLKCCKRKGYISKDDWKRLDRLAELFRNPFSHARFSHSGEVDGNTECEMHFFSLSTIEERKVAKFGLENVPFLYMKRCSKYVDANAFGYFATIMYYVNKLDLLISESIEKEKKVPTQ